MPLHFVDVDESPTASALLFLRCAALESLQRVCPAMTCSWRRWRLAFRRLKSCATHSVLTRRHARPAGGGETRRGAATAT